MKITVNKLKINDGLLYLLVVISFFSYERTIYKKYYQFMSVGVLALGITLLILNLRNRKKISLFYRNIKNNTSIHILSISIILATFLASMRHGLLTFSGLIIVSSMILILYVFYLFLPILIYEDIDNKIKKLINLITFFSIIAIIIGVRGSFLVYNPTHYKRIASIFFDPNYFGTIAAIGFIFSINRRGKYKFFAIINLIAIYYSGSRAAMISLILVMIIFFFYNKKIRFKTVLKFIVVSILACFFVSILVDINFFRANQGLNSRDYLWKLSYKLIYNEPLWGYGYGAEGDLLRSMGASNVSSHNSYLDYMVIYGIPAFVINMFVILKATFLSFKNDLLQEITKSILFLLIVANSISINLGGLGALSLLLTLFLGLSNIKTYDVSNISNSQKRSKYTLKRGASI